MKCNPYILLSRINSYLRDNDCSLDELCDLKDDLQSKEEIVAILDEIGYYYCAEHKQFLQKDKC